MKIAVDRDYLRDTLTDLVRINSINPSLVPTGSGEAEIADRRHPFEKHILYDTNSAAAPILHNLRILGKSLDEVSTVFLSHCHYDHTDGLPGILEAIGRPIPATPIPRHSDRASRSIRMGFAISAWLKVRCNSSRKGLFSR